MALKPGDRITLSIKPSIQLAEYRYIKPLVSLTRELGDDIDGDLEEMQEELRKLLWRAVRMDLELTSEAVVALDLGGIDGLVEYCLEEVGDVSKKSSIRKSDKKATKKSPKKATKKSPKKATKKSPKKA